jgi:hypothetical protein
MGLSEQAAATYPATNDPSALLVLAHGAGAGQQHPFMVAIARGLAARGIDVVTFDFPYMREGRRAPDRAPVLEGSFREVVAAAREWSRADRLFIGGKSMGGRMATHLAAEGLDGLTGTLVLGYPLHPPGKPEQLRIAHLPSMTQPLLIIQGERDTFGTPGELQPHLDRIGADVELHVIDRGDHSLAVRGRTKENVYEEVAGVAAGWLLRT